ncbi:FtsW/RodA/SpoVE family cell cycle protein [Clostridium sp. BJN0001]|uniref:FtsW/RodA/SpoVE family cell cycle protein n=1 Tax=Clostridium sp. BJN0001 TaxID=2930219 RepID=UPI001FD1E9E3|nr:FtsW/RodA/SpoVE family cell cycle protein [Clostridium sp. BJN0001]
MFKILKPDVRVLKEIDKLILISMFLLILIGTVNIYLCTKGTISVQPYYYLKKQLIGVILGIIIMYIIMCIDYNMFINFVPIFYWISVVMLILAKVPGIGIVVNGARGWMKIGGFQFQPSEIAKIAIILMLAKKLDEMDCKINDIKNFFILVLYAAIPVAFIITQPDMGMTMVCFFIVLGMFFIAGLDMRVIGGGLITLIVGILIVLNSGLLQTYQINRFTAFLNPNADDAKTTYHLNQSLIAIGSGGILGSRPSFDPDGTTGYAAQNVPEDRTDFIFTAISEQWGLIGGLAVIVLYGFMLFRMISISRSVKEIFGSLMSSGIISYFLFAIIQNIGMTMGLLPITGITLPLLSYGSSSMVTVMMSIAFVLKAGAHKKKIYF